MLLTVKIASSPSPSLFNNGEGLRVAVEYQALPLPLKPGDKRRKNAKASTVTKAIFVHENDDLFAFLRIAFDALALDLEWGIDPTTEKFDYFFYDMRLSLMRSTLKDVVIMSDKDYRSVIDEAVKRDNPQLKVSLTELPKPKVCHIQPNLANYSFTRHRTPRKKLTRAKLMKRAKIGGRKNGYVLTLLSAYMHLFILFSNPLDSRTIA